jgi:hypothetical protein
MANVSVPWDKAGRQNVINTQSKSVLTKFNDSFFNYERIKSKSAQNKSMISIDKKSYIKSEIIYVPACF